jgi:hypothetical protein
MFHTSAENPDQITRLDDETYARMIPEDIREMVAQYRENEFVQLSLLNYCVERDSVQLQKIEGLFHFVEKKSQKFPLTKDDIHDLIDFVKENNLDKLDEMVERMEEDGNLLMDMHLNYPSINDRLMLYVKSQNKGAE